MSDSKSTSDRPQSAGDLDFERDMPLTAEDVAVLRRLNRDVALSPKEYELFLEQFGDASEEELLKRPCFRGEPFEL